MAATRQEPSDEGRCEVGKRDSERDVVFLIIDDGAVSRWTGSGVAARAYKRAREPGVVEIAKLKVNQRDGVLPRLLLSTPRLDALLA